jgi:hypothetical protein
MNKARLQHVIDLLKKSEIKQKFDPRVWLVLRKATSASCCDIRDYPVQRADALGWYVYNTAGDFDWQLSVAYGTVYPFRGHQDRLLSFLASHFDITEKQASVLFNVTGSVDRIMENSGQARRRFIRFLASGILEFSPEDYRERHGENPSNPSAAAVFLPPKKPKRKILRKKLRETEEVKKQRELPF